jgi:hypothetical protein
MSAIGGKPEIGTRHWPMAALLHFRDGRNWLGTLPFSGISKTAQNFTHKIGKSGTRQSGERYWTDNINCGETQACGEEAIEHALTESRRQFGRYAVPQHLLN